MKFLSKHVKTFLADEQGATAVEYGIMVAVIAIGILTAVGGVRDALNTLFDSVTTALGG